MYCKDNLQCCFCKTYSCRDLCNLVNCIIMMGIGLAYTFQILFFFFSMGSANSSTNEVNICIPA